MIVTRRPSPNCGPRRGGAIPDIIVLHYTAMPNATVAAHRLCLPEAEVSAHYLIARQGEVVQMVDEADRAWHAGAGAWGGVRDVNSRSIGIELDNTGDQPFPEPLMAALETLLPAIMQRWSVPPERVIAHSDMAPLRKSDPGTRFDWRRLARQGVSVWPDAAETATAFDLESFISALHRFGYPRDAPQAALLRAFRLRFRPWAAGPPDTVDLALASDLARRFPVDRAAPGA